ncbi:uncharacterized protein PV09_07886 [Verruconis gallopava]|uniref:Methyltransferase domain-containing protein n=1 Tax=Verruconis gallopava TaxID=253628 RepID=A0A0D2A1I2_9PEZI|nr:uncharacterized protein PV09_07886 [Verruconis gallopava]KIW00528.1 hypothetical protein PV09_07886 [Verruconis gallopava]
MECEAWYLLGVATGVILVLVGKQVLANQLASLYGEKSKKTLYALDHAKLNVCLPPPSLWMNMGYWKNTEDFPTACEALLKEVLKAAKILQELKSKKDEPMNVTVSIIDLGFGCGDQCLYFKRVLESQTRNRIFGEWRARLEAYVGITLEQTQFRVALDRLGHETHTQLRIHCADAGRPQSWDTELQNDVIKACQMSTEKDVGIKPLGGTQSHQNWVLGLDTLYHFQPSRWGVIEYANRQLDASLMAYDLCIADDISVWMRVLLRLMSSLGQSPFANWSTVDDYRKKLVSVGYAEDKIEIHDISAHVFRPLASFLKKREQHLEVYKVPLGRYRYVARMFDWWAQTGAVRGCIIVARK